MKLKGLTALASLAILGGCIGAVSPYIQTETAQRIAAPAWMIKRDIEAQSLLIRAYERIHDKGGPVNIYIEGNGTEYSDALAWSTNPTPDNPLALHLASKDGAENVIYLARPCQYTAMASGKTNCDEKYWKSARYSQEVIDAYQDALNDIIKRYDINGMNLIGYSGGAALATLIAAERKDILSLRTVSGIIDHKAHRTLSGLDELTDSLNPLDHALNLSDLPQYHFIGGQDTVVPPAVLHNYLQSMPPTNCVQTMLVQEAEYEDGWVNKWPELLALPVECYPHQKTEEIQEPIEEIKPVFTSKEKPAKP